MPFYWVGALFSAAFLAFVITVFGLLLKAGDRAATEARESILPGLVVGIRDWAEAHGQPAIPIRSPGAAAAGSAIEEASPSAGLRLEQVRRGR